MKTYKYKIELIMNKSIVSHELPFTAVTQTAVYRNYGWV